MLVAKRDQLAARKGRHAITRWQDLLQPGLRGRIALPEAPREFVGIALKTLGHPGLGVQLAVAHSCGGGGGGGGGVTVVV